MILSHIKNVNTILLLLGFQYMNFEKTNIQSEDLIYRVPRTMVNILSIVASKFFLLIISSR